MNRSTGGAHAASSPRRPARTLVSGTLGLLAVGAVLWWTGSALPGPDTYDHQGFLAWLTTTDPIVAAFAVVRLAGLMLVTWTIISGALGLIVHRSALRRRRRLTRLVDRLCLPAVRRLVHTAAGVALATATLAPGAASAAEAVPTRQVATVVVLDDDELPAEPEAPATTPTGVTERAVVVALDDAPPRPTTTSAGPTPTEDGEPAPTASSPEPEPATSTTSAPPEGSHPDPGPHTPTTWQIRPGEHLWHVATVVLGDHLGRPAADPEVARYLAVLVETNRDRLVVPTDPDLVMVGQVFALPDPATLDG